MDPYKTLGVNPKATEAELKQAFRSLAKKYHPDTKNGDERKFKEVNEAYQQAMSRLGMPEDDDDDEIIPDYDPSIFTFRFMKTMTIHITIAEAYYGATKSIMIEGGRPINIQIPPGTYRGAKVNKTIGNTSIIGIIDIIPDKRYRMMNHLDMETMDRVDVVTLITGGTARIETICGPAVMTVPPLTNPGTVFRLAGKGFKSGLSTGDLFVTLEAKMPDNPEKILSKLKEI